MDRGTVADTMTTPTSHIQINHYDLGDSWSLFIAAHEPVFDGDSPVVYDWPVDTEHASAFPEFMTVEELDLFIEKLQAQRAWLAETNYDTREEM